MAQTARPLPTAMPRCDQVCPPLPPAAGSEGAAAELGRLQLREPPLGVLEHGWSVDVLPEAAADVDHGHAARLGQPLDSFGQGGICLVAVDCRKRLEQGPGADEQASIDAVELGELFADLSELAIVCQDLGRILHVEDRF